MNAVAPLPNFKRHRPGEGSRNTGKCDFPRRVMAIRPLPEHPAFWHSAGRLRDFAMQRIRIPFQPPPALSGPLSQAAFQAASLAAQSVQRALSGSADE